MTLKTYAQAPLLIAQALWVMTRAARLPEASGPRSGSIGTGPAKKVLVLGDSSAAGVGVTHQTEALGGQLAQALSSRFSVTWKVLAKSGATVRSTLKSLEDLPQEDMDFVLIALGVNDTKNGVSAKRWEDDYRRLLTVISDTFGAPSICATGVPPLGHFPLLPSPLNTVLGSRAERFDSILLEIASERDDTRHLPMSFPLDTTLMATDGFHPGPEVYKEWARRAAELFMQTRR